MERFGGKSFLQSDLDGMTSEYPVSQLFTYLKDLYSKPYSERNLFFFMMKTGEGKGDDAICEDDVDDVFLTDIVGSPDMLNEK